MRRRIILMRHAKSDWSRDGFSDHDRPLNERGRRDAPVVGEKLVKLGWVPDCVLSSDAARTRETYELMSAKFPTPVATSFRTDLYMGRVSDVDAALRSLDDTAETVLLLGHNPTWELVLAWLSGEERVLKTAHAALLEASLHRSMEHRPWSSLFPPAGTWRLLDVIVPRD